MVWGWKHLHSMQRFLAEIWHFVNFDKIVKSRQKPLHGMGWVGVLVFLSKMAKTRCVSDLQGAIIVRHAASFGTFGKNGAKTRCVSGNLSRERYRPLWRWQTGDEFWSPSHSARDPGKIGGRWLAAGQSIRHTASFGDFLGFWPRTRCVSG